LIDSRSDPASLATCHDDFCNFESGKVAQPKLLELALLVQLVDAFKRPFEGYTPIRGMQVEDVDVVCLELLQRLLESLSQYLGFVFSRRLWVGLGRDGEIPLLVTDCRCEGFL
jgi:hypothetical protein